MNAKPRPLIAPKAKIETPRERSLSQLKRPQNTRARALNEQPQPKAKVLNPSK